MKKILFIYNPHSGKGSIKSNVADIIDVFSECDNIVTVFPTKYKNHAKAIVMAHASDYDLIVCSGGDGTINEVINGLMLIEKSPLLGYIPAGTVNDFANNLKLNDTPVEIAKTIMDGKYFAIDIGTLNDTAFTYFAGFGLFTDVAHQTPQEFKHSFGRTAYIIEGVKRLSSIKTYNLELTTEQETISGEFIFGMVTNSKTIGGFRKFGGENVKLDDGLFEIMLAYMPKTALESQALVQSILTKTENSDYIYRTQANHIEIKALNPIDWTIDGEFGGSHSHVIIKNHNKAINIIKN